MDKALPLTIAMLIVGALGIFCWENRPESMREPLTATARATVPGEWINIDKPGWLRVLPGRYYVPVAVEHEIVEELQYETTGRILSSDFAGGVARSAFGGPGTIAH